MKYQLPSHIFVYFTETLLCDGKLNTEQYWSRFLRSTGTARSVSNVFGEEEKEISSSNAWTACISICFKGKVDVQASCPYPDLYLSLPHHQARQLLPEASQSTSRSFRHSWRLALRINLNPWGNGMVQMSSSRPYDVCANIPWLAQKALCQGTYTIPYPVFHF